MKEVSFFSSTGIFLELCFENTEVLVAAANQSALGSQDSQEWNLLHFLIRAVTQYFLCSSCQLTVLSLLSTAPEPGFQHWVCQTEKRHVPLFHPCLCSQSAPQFDLDYFYTFMALFLRCILKAKLEIKLESGKWDGKDLETSLSVFGKAKRHEIIKVKICIENQSQGFVYVSCHPIICKRKVIKVTSHESSSWW